MKVNLNSSRVEKIDSKWVWILNEHKYETFLGILQQCDYYEGHTQCLKIPQNVAFEFYNLGILHQFLTY